MGAKSNPTVKRTQQKSDDRPVLFLDVDGVISLFGFNPSGPLPGTFHSIDGILHCIGTQASARLARLSNVYEMVWATGWEEKANEYLVHILGLEQELPVLTFDGRAVFGSSHWKVEAIDDYSRGRPAAWIDDNLDERAENWAANRREPTLLIHTDAAEGITDAQVDALLGWAREAKRVSPGQATREEAMAGGNVDKTKGRVKDAAGALTDDESLRAEGKVDKASGSTKNAVGKAADKIKDAIPGKHH